MARKLLLALFLSLLPLALFFFATPAHAVIAIVVNSHSDVINPADNLCTLREAVIAINTHAPSGGAIGECPGAPGIDTIVLPSGIFTFTMSGAGEDNAATGDLDLKQDMTIQGQGSACLVNPTCTRINTNFLDRAFDITTTVQATITGMDIWNGSQSVSWGGGGIRNLGVLKLSDAYLTYNGTVGPGGGLNNTDGAVATLDRVGFLLNYADRGGAIANRGTMTLSKTIFNLDNALLFGGGIYNEYPGIAMIIDSGLGGETAATDGGGIHNDGDLTLNRVLLSTNKATSGNGGGLYSNGYITLTNVTLSSNIVSTTLGARGGAIYVNGGGSTLTNVTIYNNTAASGGGIYNDSFVWLVHSLENTIIYSNTTGNCAGNAITSLGYNLDGGNTCGFSDTSDLTNTNPLLGHLQYNGGWHFLFQTHALLPGSPAINKIPFGTNGCGATITTDQRGASRPIGSSCDIGAYEAAYLFLPLILK